MDTCMSPMAYPARPRGTVAATRALVAPMTPVINPWIMRRATNSSAERAKAINAMMTAPPNMDRATISLRPHRSAKAPQMGEAIIMLKACPEKTSPVQRSALRDVTVPRDFT